MSISSVTPTLAGAPETILRRAASDVRADQLPVDTTQMVNARQAVDGRPQTIQTAEPGERAVKRREREDQQGNEVKEQTGPTEAEQQAISELKQRDQEVRDHEQAHLSAAGPYALGGAQYELTVGPDGKSYATGGEVKIDATPIPDKPAATIAKMETVRGAALAPTDPSGKDRQVAAVTSREISKAQSELSTEQRIERPGPESPISSDSRISRASSEYARSDALPDDPRRSLFDFTV